MGANGELSGKRALVTGSARGIGFSIAEDLAEWGSDIIILDINRDDCEKAASDLSQRFGVNAVGYKCNISSRDELAAVAKEVKAASGELNFLVNNAGVTRDNLLLRMKEEEWDLVMDVNLKGAFLTTQAFLPLLLKSKGDARIINISSISGLLGQVGQTNYSSSKAGLIGFTKAVAREYAKKGIRANAVCPGFIKTAMTDELAENLKEEVIKNIPLGRMGEVKDISQVVRFLCTESAGYITGNIIRIDGGMGTGV